MIIRSEKEYKVVDKTWGMEQWIINKDLFEEYSDVPYCHKIIMCIKGMWSSEGKWHKHPKKDETFYVIDGILELEIDGDGTHHLKRGDSARIRPQTGHRFRSMTTHCAFIEVSTTHEDDDTIRY